MNIISEIRKLKEQIQRIRIIDGDNYKTISNPPGTKLHIEIPRETEESTGTSILWAIVTAVTDSENYTCDIYSSQGSYENGDDPTVEDAAVMVINLEDELEVGDGFSVRASAITDVDYEAIENIGLL